MPTAKKSARLKKATASRRIVLPAVAAVNLQGRWHSALSPFASAVQWVRGLQSRTPHRSFRRTRRRDYVRSLELPGYIAFTVEVWRTLWQHKTTFGLLTGSYALLSGLLVGLASQDTYAQLAELLRATGADIFKGNLGQLGEAGLLLAAGLSGGLNPGLTQAQQLIAGLLVLMIWLTTVWLLRAYIAGQRPQLRDGLYNAGAPIVPTFLVGLLLIAQLLPVGIVAIGVSAAIPTGLLNEGVEAMLFWVVALLLVLLSLYWITSTFLALVVVTLPGMYPMQALKTAGELVIGRRFRILLRIVWLLLVSLVFLALVMIPLILFDAWFKGLLPTLQWLPVVPVGLLFMSAFSVVWAASYVYMLYRKVVDDDAAPA